MRPEDKKEKEDAENDQLITTFESTSPLNKIGSQIIRKKSNEKECVSIQSQSIDNLNNNSSNHSQRLKKAEIGNSHMNFRQEKHLVSITR